MKLPEVAVKLKGFQYVLLTISISFGVYLAQYIPYIERFAKYIFSLLMERF